uniref:Uncharacterized protein n=1 Tax=Aegilops tauschii subsp. strangulata TaxID=200361 RepID=A0A452Y252_AEGTS
RSRWLYNDATVAVRWTSFCSSSTPPQRSASVVRNWLTQLSAFLDFCLSPLVQCAMYILESTAIGSLCCSVLRVQSVVMMLLVLCEVYRFSKLLCRPFFTGDMTVARNVI